MMTEILETGQVHGRRISPSACFTTWARTRLAAMPHRRKIIEEMLPKINCIVTNDLEFSDTVHYSDIVLPCTPLLRVRMDPGRVARAVHQSCRTGWWSLSARPRRTSTSSARFPKYLDNEACTTFLLQDQRGDDARHRRHAGVARNWVSTSTACARKASSPTARRTGFTGKTSGFQRFRGVWSSTWRIAGARINIGKPIDKEFYHLPTYHTPSEAYDESELVQEVPAVPLLRAHSLAHAYAVQLRADSA